jgi:hypothetical protein
MRNRLRSIWAPQRQGADDPPRSTTGQPGTVVVAWLVLPAVGAMTLFTLAGSSGGERWANLGVAAMVAAGGFAIGTALGFLFGIPRTLTAGGRAQHAAAGADESADDGRPRYQPNTNLEDISDWLTKILVGAGLVELTRLVRAVGRLADSVALALGGTAGARGAEWAFALGLLVAFPVSGFLAGYLHTRLRLQAIFARADDVNVTEIKADVIREVDEQKKADAEAQALVSRQLNPDDLPHPSERELDAAVIAASDGARKQIFTLARGQRRANWRHDKAKMALTIPVFHALIAADPDERYFRNHGELGFAQHDLAQPDYEAAASSLDKAIEIRDRLGIAGFQRYDWVRAMCRMQAPAGDPHSAQSQILADLRRAATDPEVAILMRQEATIRAWCERNGLDLDQVVPPPQPV